MQSYKGQRERLEMPFKKEDKCAIFAETEVSGEKDKYTSIIKKNFLLFQWAKTYINKTIN